MSLKEEITLSAVKEALCQKIRNYPGGIDGVWMTISPQFKEEEIPNPTGIKRISKKKLSRDNFRKQIIRLNSRNSEKKDSNEKITFTVKNSFLLLINILDILIESTHSEPIPYKSIIDFLLEGSSFLKDDIDVINRETNINSKEILIKLNEINKNLVKSQNRKTRFTVYKVCQDFEKVLNELYYVINYNPEGPKSPIYEFIHSNSQEVTEQSRLALMAFEIMKNFRLYFSQDVLMHNYSKDILFMKKSDYNKNKKSFLLSPLYILYFYIIVNKKFLSVITGIDRNAKDRKNNNKPFTDDNVKDNQLMNDKPISKIILNTVNNIHECLKYILRELEECNLKIAEEKYNENVKIMRETIELFYNLHTKKIRLSPDWLMAMNLNDFYDMMLMGRTILFVPSESDIEKLYGIKNHLEKIKAELKRNK